MARLFEERPLRDHLAYLIAQAKNDLDALPEDEFLARSVDDLCAHYVESASSEPLTLTAATWDDRVDGDVEEIRMDVTGDHRYWSPHQGQRFASGQKVWAAFPWSGNRSLFTLQPSRRLMIDIVGDVREDGTLVVWHKAVGEMTAAGAQSALMKQIESINKTVDDANRDVAAHNAQLPSVFRPLVERRRARLLKRRDLSGELGFRLGRRTDAPRPMPLNRKVLGASRRRQRDTTKTLTYADEWALVREDYEDVIGVVRSALRACERTPGVVTAQEEENLRDLILILLNGTFEGTATGETFVAAGKTDILVRIEDRHVFVGECKWWSGAKNLGDAIDQLLSYLPWRDEKAALVLFIREKDASAIIEKAHTAITSHAAYKRKGDPGSEAPGERRNYVLGHPEDMDREIEVALLIGVIRGRP